MNNHLKASLELDKQVAKNVMGYGELHGTQTWKPFSSDIASAWEVLEKLKSLCDGDIHIECLNEQWAVSSCYREETWKDFVYADNAPLAICLAALQIVEKKENSSETS